MCRSVRQTAQAWIFRRTCPGPGAGAGVSSSRRGCPAPLKSIARIARPTLLELGDAATRLARRRHPDPGLADDPGVLHRTLELRRGDEGPGSVLVLEVVGHGHVGRVSERLVDGVARDAHAAPCLVEVVVSLSPRLVVGDVVAYEETNHAASL